MVRWLNVYSLKVTSASTLTTQPFGHDIINRLDYRLQGLDFMALISVVSPVYKAENCLQELYRRLVDNISLITSDFEIILVEDGGDDNSWAVIKEISQNDPRVKGIKFTRNFGVHHAITAGLDISKGDWTIVIECDLQSPPERIKDLYSKALEGYEVVIARFTRRNENIVRRFCSRVYWRFMSYLSGMNLDPQHGIYRIMSKTIVNNFRLFTESDRHLKAIIAWIGGGLCRCRHG